MTGTNREDIVELATNAEAIDGRRRNVIVSTEGVEEHGDARYIRKRR